MDVGNNYIQNFYMADALGGTSEITYVLDRTKPLLDIVQDLCVKRKVRLCNRGCK